MDKVEKIAFAQRVIAGLLSLILGRKCTVEWGQEASCKADKTIQLPRPKTGDADEVALLTRKALHEAGHEKHTDFGCIEGLEGNVRVLMNALEDPRIEYEQIKAFPGAGLILNRGLEDVIRAVDDQLDAGNPEHSADLVTVNVLLKGFRRLVSHLAMREGADNLVAKGDQVLGQEGIEAVGQAIDRLEHCTNTADVVKLANDLWVALQPQEAEPQQPQQAPDDQDQQDDLGNVAEANQTAKSQTAEPEDGGDGEGHPDANDQSDSESSETSNASGDSSQEDAPADDADGECARTGDQDSDQSASKDTHNQDNSEVGNGGTPQESESGGGPNQGGPVHNGKLDLNSAMRTDLGSMLAMAYEHKFGNPDVDAPGQALAAKTTTATEEFTQMVATALARAAYEGDSLEHALELIQVALHVASSSDNGDGVGSESQSSVGAGGGNCTGASIPFDQSSRLNGSVSRLVRIFTKELQDKRRRTVKLAPAGGQVAANRVWRLKALGDTNVFKVTSSVRGIDAAATLLLDRSYSMKKCIVEAAVAALSCSQALERISKVKTSIEMFPGYEGTAGNTVTLQAFGQSARQVAGRVKEVNAEGFTPLAEALREAIPRLLAQRVKKRFVFLVTDGQPNNLASALAEIGNAEKLGVEFVGIGIGEYGKAIEGLTPFSVCINAASELPDAFEKLFRGNIAMKLAA